MALRPVSLFLNPLRLVAGLIVAVLAFAGTAAWAQLPARPNGPILDAAAILAPPQEAALDRKLRTYNTATGRAIIVATIPSLGGQEAERYAQELARAWGIGGTESQEGVLFLIAPNERKLRVHTSVGTQGTLTDGFVGQLLRTEVTPRLKENDYAGGINAGVDGLIAQLDRDPVDAKAVAEAADAAAAQRSERGSPSSFPQVIVWLIVMVMVIGFFGRGRRRQGYRRSGIDPGIVLWGISEAMRHGSGSGGWGGGDSDGGDFGGFGGFGGGGGGFDGGGASGDW